MMPAVPEKRFLGMNRITDEEGDVDTRQWSPVPLGGFETNASHRIYTAPEEISLIWPTHR